MKPFLPLLAALALIVLPVAAQPASVEANLPNISLIAYQSLDPVHPLTVAGQLRVPAGKAVKMPAVVIVHGSAGIDSRGMFYAQALNQVGIATLEIDLWAARGWLGGISGRPRGVPETLPDAYGALEFLAKQPFIDATRIGIMGFSWGGVVTMLTATQPYTDRYTGGGLKFAAHVANYPVCWVYNHNPGYEFSSLTGAPVLIQVGELDAYDLPDSCSNLVQSLTPAQQEHISYVAYKGATHAWDRLQAAVTVTDPYSHLGKGGQVEMVPNPGVAEQSRDAAIRFFQRVLSLTTTRETSDGK